MVGQILLQENKMLQLEEINDIEKLMPDMIVEIITPKIKGFSKFMIIKFYAFDFSEVLTRLKFK